MFIMIAFYVLLISCAAATDPQLEVTSGQLLGKVVEFSHEDVNIQRTLNVFLGIPYAEPPVGDLRFQPPQTKVPWDGVYNATYTRPICIQSATPTRPVESQSEDCLFLNIYAPQTQGANLPVMIWLHGGDFTSDSGSAYDGSALSAIGEVIVVTINYRLGALGYFTTGDEYATGNYGFLDQIGALQWVQDNIQAFGGDVNNVAIFGQSAGAVSVDSLLLSPLTDGLFHRAIIESGTATMDGAFRNDPDYENRIAHALGEVVGCQRDNTEDLVQCLLTVPAADFRDPSDRNTGQLSDALGEEINTRPFSPYVDGYFMTDMPRDILSNGGFTKTEVDILIGTNADEGTFVIASVLTQTVFDAELFINKTVFEQLYPFLLPPLIRESPAALDAVELMYVDWATAEATDANYADATTQIIGDTSFVTPTDQSARAYSEAGANVYRYFMTHSPSNSELPMAWAKAYHGAELQFVFGYHFLDIGWIMPQEEVNMSLTIMTYWSNFATTGNPNSDSSDLEEWPLFKVPGLAYKELAPDMTTKEGVKAAECVFWHEYIPQLLQYTDCTSRSTEIKATVVVVGFFFLITSLYVNLQD